MTRIDKAKYKRFNLLCRDKSFRNEFWWWRFKIIGNAQYIENPLPRFNGDRESVLAYREHVRDLIKVYAKRKRLSCGHMSRKDHCVECAENSIAEFEAFKKSWLAKKGCSDSEWLAKVESWKVRNPEKAALNTPSEYILSILRQS